MVDGEWEHAGHEDCRRMSNEARVLIERGLQVIANIPCQKEEYGATLPTRWMLFAEFMDMDGDRWPVPIVSPSTTSYDIVGFMAVLAGMAEQGNVMQVEG